MDVERPFFSILIPSYNRPTELKRCIQSVLQSAFTDFEIIISDDNSPRQAEIENIVFSVGSASKVRFYKQLINLKEPGNKNFLVNQATGHFNIILCDDDTLCEDSLGFLNEYININPNSDIYGFGYKIVDEVGNSLSAYVSTKTIKIDNISSRLLTLEAGLLPMSLFHPATFCCRSGLEMQIPYRHDVGIGEDLCFLLQAIVSNHSIEIVPKILFNWRKVQDIDSISQGNQSAEFLASFASKRLIYNFLSSGYISDFNIKRRISTVRFRFKFLYIELLRLANVERIDFGQHMDKEMLDEFMCIKYSIFWRLNLFFIRPLRAFDLFLLVGFIDFFKIMYTRYSTPKKRLRCDK